MKKIDKIEKANTIEEAIGLLSKGQLKAFGGVISFFQIRNNWNYFLDERESRRYFIEYFITSKLRESTIVEQRNIVCDYIEMYVKDNQRQKVINIAKAIAKGKTVCEINEIATS